MSSREAPPVSSSTSERPERTYRPERLVLVHRVVAGLAVVWILVGQAVGGGSDVTWADRGWATLAAAVVAGAIVGANRRRIEVHADRLQVVNLLTSRSWAWGELRQVTAAANGLVVDPLEGSRYVGTIVGVQNWRPRLDGPSPAPEIADLAMDRARVSWSR